MEKWSDGMMEEWSNGLVEVRKGRSKVEQQR
jgi:hypothetical protein